MKSLYAFAATVVLAGAAVAATVQSRAPDRPPGVSADEWAPISDTLGIVLVQGMIPTGSQRLRPLRPGLLPNTGAALISPVSGYLMVRRGRTWQRLIVIDPVKGPGAAG